MPELPDVEGWRRYLAEHATGARIGRVTAPDPDVIRNTTPQGLGRAVRGRHFAAPERHGKWLFAPLSDGEREARPGTATTVVFHFGMTGRLEWTDERGRDRGPHDRVIFVCDAGELRVEMQRKLGGVWLTRTRSELRAVTGPLGPDGTQVDVSRLAERLGDRRGGVKSALMDQEMIAGLGNLMVDEILWTAGIDPTATARELDEEQVENVHDALRTVLDRSIPAGRVPPDEGTLTAARDEDEPRCPRCGQDLERERVASRSTYRCPACQR